MPLYFQNRRRKKTLREEVLRSKAPRRLTESDGDEDCQSVVSLRSNKTRKSSSNDSFINTTPSSLKGSFLKNKLDNPLFKSLFFKKSTSTSTLSKVFNASDSEEEEEEGEDEEDFLESDSETEKGVESEQETEAKWSFLSLTRSRRRNSFSANRSRRFGSSFLFKNKREKKRSALRMQLRLSDRSNSSQSSTDSALSSSNEESEENEVDTLTKLEDDGENVNSSNENNFNLARDLTRESYLLYTHKGQAVRVQFFFDYLLISPVIYKLSLSRPKSKPRIIYYEDLALWTNNTDCLRMVHIKNKNTAKQERSEIKLFISKKKKSVTASQLNDELKDRVSVLMAGKMNIEVSEARQLLNQNNTAEDVDRVVQKIDRNGEKCIAHSYANLSEIELNLKTESPCLDLLNV